VAEPLAADARAAARGGVALLVVQTLGRVLAAGFVVVVTRSLGPAEFGRYSVVAAIVLVANFVGDFGTTPALTRLVSRRPADAEPLLTGTALASFGLGLLAYALSVAFAAVAGYPGHTVVDVVIGGAAIPAAAVLTSVLGTFDGRGFIDRRSAISFLQAAITAVGGAGAVLAGTGVRGAIAALGVAPWVALAVSVVVARRSGLWSGRPGFDFARCVQLFRTALPFAFIGGLGALSMRFDVILLSVLRSPSETASYDLAQRVVEAFSYLSAAVFAPALFLLNRRLAAHDVDGARRAFGEAVRILYIVGLPASVGLILLAEPIAKLAFGSRYGIVAAPLEIIGASLCLGFVIYLQSALLMSGDVIRRGMGVVAFNAIQTLALDVVLVPLYGARGAATAVVVSSVISAWNLDRFHRRTIGIPTPLPSPGIVASTVALAAVVLVVRAHSFLGAVAAGAAAYVVTLVLTRAVTRQDVTRFAAILRRRSPAT